MHTTLFIWVYATFSLGLQENRWICWGHELDSFATVILKFVSHWNRCEMVWAQYHSEKSHTCTVLFCGKWASAGWPPWRRETQPTGICSGVFSADSTHLMCLYFAAWKFSVYSLPLPPSPLHLQTNTWNIRGLVKKFTAPTWIICRNEFLRTEGSTLFELWASGSWVTLLKGQCIAVCWCQPAY